MRLLTDEQHASLVDVIERYQVKRQDFERFEEAIATLTAAQSVEVTAWMRSDRDLIHRDEKRSDYAYTHYYDTPLYAIKKETT